MNGVVGVDAMKTIEGSNSCRKMRMSRAAVWRKVVCFISLLLLPSCCFAWTCNKIGAQYETITGPSEVSVSRNKANGTPISDWFYSTLEVYRNCTGDSANTMGTQYYAVGLTKVSGITVDGYSVYKTNIEGVGVALAAKGRQCSTWGPFYSVEATLSGGGSCSPRSNLDIGGQLALRYVKIGDVSGGKVDLNYPVTAYSQIDGKVDWGGDNTRRYLDAKETTVKVLACATPDVSVSLGNHPPAEMPNVGSRTTAVKFDLGINDCPPGIASISYGFNFYSGTGYTAKEGTFGLKADATAKGIRVKLLRADGTTTVEFDKWYTLTDYNSGTGGSYKVPLSAAYVRTADITAGSADAELVIAMSYN